MGCNQTNKGCGCEDSALRTIPVYPCPPDGNCPNPSTCDEYIDISCVIFPYGLSQIRVPPGMSLMEFLQRSAIQSVDPSCIDQGSACQSSTYIYPINKTTTTILLGWYPSATAVSYQVEYKEESSGTWILFPVQSAANPTQLMISGLITGTTYNIRVNATCGVGNCYSAIITVKTN